MDANRNNPKLAELEGLRDSLYMSANEIGPGSAAYNHLVAQIDKINGEIAEATNRQSYQYGEQVLASAKTWDKAA